jgi:hypothetical protein
MGLLEGLIAGDRIRQAQENLALRQEEAKLHAQLFASRQKWYDAQAKLLEHNLAKGQALSQKLRDVLTSSSAGTAEPAQGGPQDTTSPAPAYEQEQPGAVPTPDQPGQSMTQRLTPPTDETQQRLAFAKKYGPPSDQSPLQAFSRQYGPQPPPQAALSPAPALEPPGEAPAINQDADQEPSPAAILDAPTGTEAVAPAPRARPSAAQRLSGTPAPSDQDDDTLLRNLAQTYFVHERPEIGLRIWGYADQQRRLREAGTFYRSLLQNPQVDEGTRRGALAGLGNLLIQAGKVDDAMKMLRPYMAPSGREMLEKASAGTRDILLEQIERGEQPNIAKANQEAAQRRKATR